MIILIPKCGLCNRMRSINGMYYLCRKMKKRLVVFWVINEEMGAATTDLFELPPDINVFNIKNNEGIFWKATYFILCHLFYYISDKEVKRMRSKKITLKMKKEFSKKIVVCETDADIIQNINSKTEFFKKQIKELIQRREYDNIYCNR